ncbi:amidohydrolase family protein [Streptomyces brasiliensis]|uniref:Organophopsphate acid anhydrase n=1 Tax=Streptomyces brasiliensis TaxID=1954 RepID=A0A917KYI6_9ACTN|nr:amidohydrolase family protein [Streptomyces brasiliensis]GGJ33351.1 organophopsphate acid anhydrase [Streptomyces brasiliensis]
MSATAGDGARRSSGEGTAAVLYEGARVIVGDGETVIDDAGLVVRDGLIEWIGPRDAISPDPTRQTVSLAGRTVMPALVNPHGHIGYWKGAAADAGNFSADNVIDHLRRLAYYGVSVFQSLGTDRDDTEIRVRDRQRKGELDDEDLATLHTAGAGIVAPTPGSGNGGPFFAADAVHEATSPEDARRHVRALAAKHVDAVKFWLDDRHGTEARLEPDVYRAIVDEAHRHGLKAAAHIYTVDDAKEAIRAGADILAHLPRTPAPDEELITLLTTHDVAVFTSMSIQRPDGDSWLDDPALADLVTPEAIADLRSRIRANAPQPLFDTLEAYQRMQSTLRTFADAGVRLVFSADTGLLTQFPGFAEHRELEALAAAGLPPLTVLQSATQRSATLLGLTDRGTLEEGRRADFVVLAGDPLRDITNTRRIESVHFKGRPVDRSRIRERVREAARHESGAGRNPAAKE